VSYTAKVLVTEPIGTRWVSCSRMPDTPKSQREGLAGVRALVLREALPPRSRPSEKRDSLSFAAGHWQSDPT
jgi:hypothetical protein